jgi:outer membrane protein OmpA-like peptidoglycan-associated protein
MDRRRAQSLRNPSRTAAKIAVVVLIVIAIAGLVLSGLSSRTSAASDATQEGGSALTGAAADAQQPTHGPNQIGFAPASATLSEAQAAKLGTLAETAKKQNQRINIVSRTEVGADQMALARQRVIRVRQTLEQSGIPLGRMTTEISQSPHGAVSAVELSRVEVVLR